MTKLSKVQETYSWDPFRELDELSGRLNRWFGRDTLVTPLADWTPRANIHETLEAYEVQAELPQVKKEDVKVTLDHGLLTLSGERRYEKKEGEGNKAHRVETSYGSFMRAFRLPEDADLEKIDARFDHGMLNIKVARLAGSKPQATKTIQVK